MTIDEHRELLSRVKYKPGWTFELHEEQNGYLSLVVHADVPDSWAPESQTHISMSYTFSKSVFSPNSGSFFQFVRQSVETTERHEFSEWFKVDDVRWPTTNHALFCDHYEKKP